MAVSKNMIVRVGADLSQLKSGFRSAGQSTRQFADDTGKNVQKASGRMKSLSKELDDLRSKISSWKGLGFSANDPNLQAATARIREIEEEMRRLRGEDAGASTTAGAMDQIAQEATAAAASLNRVSDAEREVSSEQQRVWAGLGSFRDLRTAIQEAGGAGALARTALAGVGRGIATVGRGAASVARSGLRALGNGLRTIGQGALSGLRSVASHIASIGRGARSARGGVGGLGASIKQIGVLAVGLRIAGAAMGRFRSLVRSAISENETLQVQCNSLKSAMSQALAPAIGVVMNALSAIMPYILGVSNAIGSLIANLFGTGWSSAASGATAAAEATSGAAAAQKEYNAQLMGFDEINKLDSSSGGGGSGGGGGGGGGEVTTQTIAGKLPTWLTDLADQLKAAISAGNWTGVGEILASKLGTAVDLARSKINDPAFRAKVSGIVSAVTDTINGFFGQLTETDGAGNSIAGNIGKLIGDGVGLALNSINQFLTGVNWTNIGTAVAQSINGVLSSLSSNDVNFGTVLGNLINAGIQGAGGIVRNLNWSGLGSEIARNVNNFFSTIDWAEAGRTLSDSLTGILDTITTGLREIDWAQIGTAIKDFISNVDWAGVASGLAEALGTLAGGIASALWAALGQALTDTYEYFKQNIEDCGGNVIAGIGQGIINWLANVGTWMYNNIWTPFVNGFKSTFSIQSPSSSPTIQGLGSDLIHGLFNGMISWLSNISTWLKTNVWGKIVSGFQTLFNNNPIKVVPKFDPVISVDEDGFGGSKGGTFGKDNGKDATPYIDVQGVLKGIDQSKLPPKDKIVHGGGIVAEKMSDRLTQEQKTFNTTSRFTGRSDNLNTSQKTLDTTSRFSYRTDNLSTSQKTLNTTSKWSWVSDNLSSGQKTISTTSNYKDSKNSLTDSKLTLATIAKFAKAVDNVSESNRTLDAIARFTKSVNKIPESGRTIDALVKVTKGWKGSLEKALGIESLQSKLYISAPKVGVNYDTFKWYNTKYKYPSSFYTYYARGGILDAATLLGIDRTGAHVAGEAGREAVLPLENHTEWMDRIAEKTAALLGGANGRQVIENKVILDGRVVAQSTKEIWRSEARAGGNPLLGIA